MATSRVNELHNEIISSTADAIIRLDPITEIEDMVVDSKAYRQILQAWVDPDTDLNILQIAVAVGHVEAAKFFSSNKYQDVFGSIIWGDRDDLINPPLHLACKVGSLELIKYFIEVRHCDIEARAVVTYSCEPESEDIDDDDEYEDEDEFVFDEGACGFSEGSKDENRDGISRVRSYDEYFEKFLPHTPYEICVREGHLHCANYLCSSIAKSIEKPLHPVSNSSLLHQCTYLGSAGHIRLLLDTDFTKNLNKRDYSGYMPIHIASLIADADCIETLLQYGAKVNSRADHRSCLHLMYWGKFRSERALACTQILVACGIDVNAMDHNNNTALDYLAWELGQKWYKVPRSLQKVHRITDSYRYPYGNANDPKQETCDDGFRLEIVKCMRYILESGASTLVRNGDGLVDHSIVHTLLQNTGWPLNCSLRQRPLDVYKDLELLFKFGADPNVIAKNNNESALTMLLMHSLHEVPPEFTQKFLSLFIMNSANLECLIPEPKQYKGNYSDRRWNIYPVMVALQERHPIALIRMMYHFMSLPSVYHSLRMTEERFLWHRMTYTLDGSSVKEDQYHQEWLLIRTPKVRSLKHSCKLLILKCLNRKGDLADYLPLPKAIINHIKSTHC